MYSTVDLINASYKAVVQGTQSVSTVARYVHYNLWSRSPQSQLNFIQPLTSNTVTYLYCSKFNNN